MMGTACSSWVRAVWPVGGEGEDRIGWWQEQRSEGEMRKGMIPMSYIHVRTR